LSLDEDEINRILEAHGHGPVEHENVGPCGLTDYYRDEFTTMRSDGERARADNVVRGIIKERLMALLTAPES
jgi:hypothetical protein